MDQLGGDPDLLVLVVELTEPVPGLVLAGVGECEDTEVGRGETDPGLLLVSDQVLVAPGLAPPTPANGRARSAQWTVDRDLSGLMDVRTCRQSGLDLRETPPRSSTWRPQTWSRPGTGRGERGEPGRRGPSVNY